MRIGNFNEIGLALNHHSAATDLSMAVSLEVVMVTLARTFSRALPAASFQLDILRQLAVFCGAAVAVWLLIATYGLDLSPGFF
jgi:ribose/xylose/arabinose/galactoside ABC-type transport system permease subunit